MADTKISELSAVTPAEGDYVVLVDSSGGVTAKATVGNLLVTEHPSYTLEDDLRVPLIGAGARGVNDPDFDTFKDGVYTYLFDPVSDEELFFVVQIPHTWAPGTNLEPHIHWAPTTTNTGNVVWGLEYTIAEIGGTFGTTNTLTKTVAASGTAYQHTMTYWSDIDMSSIDSVSTMLVCRVFRDANNADDTYTGDAAAIEVDFHYQISRLGDEVE